MAGKSAATFGCTACGKQYGWKQELAGRKVRCKCGEVMVAPSEPPSAPEADTYGFADDPPATTKPARSAAAPGAALSADACPGCGKPLAAEAAICVQCGYNRKTGGKLKTHVDGAAIPMAAKAVPARPGAAAVARPAPSSAPAGVPLGYATPEKPVVTDVIEGSRVMDLWVPVALVLVGTVASLAELMHFNPDYKVSFATAIPMVGIHLIVDMVLLLVGCLAAVKMMDIAFGAPAQALLKLAAISIAPAALGNIICQLLGDNTGMVSWMVSLILYFGLFKPLFGLDLGEIMMLTSVVWLIRTWVGMFIWMFLMHLLFSGALSGGGGGSSSSGFSAPPGGNGSAIIQEDGD